MKYAPDSEISSFNVLTDSVGGTVEAFAADLCVTSEDIGTSLSVDMSKATSAVLFDLNKKETIYSKNAHEQLHPASLTKVMTALVAMKYGSLDQVLTATDSVTIHESGAQLLGLKPGDTMTLDQALHALLMYSANDVANLIAENIGGGSIDSFVNMMNQEAQRIGATNTSFLNPHGLTQDGHYTTAYDLYLIFNEAIKYDTFNEIIHMNSYQMTYYNADGEPKERTIETTNLFLKGNYSVPDNVNVIGGKTGTTTQL
jgi:D-alanyl-D-alanine carboxypeptidase